jgi:serine/threonine-protein kinase
MGYSEVIPNPGVEILPGYVLVSWLGRGGFGEVWQAVGPDDRPCALKFVDLDQGHAAREARGLDYMKSIHHPHLLEIRAIVPIRSALIIAMELAGGTLMDRLHDARKCEHAGIPGRELIAYMRQAADGIDFLNSPRHCIDGTPRVRIVHQDIKPHNLLLVGDSVKVADFGFAKTLIHSVTAKTAGLTPAYAPPEFFEGEVTGHSDQYSLAVTYCELRGGRLPFAGTAFQIMAQKKGGVPDLMMIPEPERAIVLRALAQQRHDRWPSCRAFVDVLSQSLCDDPSSGIGVSPRVCLSTIDRKPLPITTQDLGATAPQPGDSQRSSESSSTLLSLIRRLLGCAGR